MENSGFIVFSCSGNRVGLKKFVSLNVDGENSGCCSTGQVDVVASIPLVPIPDTSTIYGSASNEIFPNTPINRQSASNEIVPNTTTSNVPTFDEIVPNTTTSNVPTSDEIVPNTRIDQGSASNGTTTNAPVAHKPFRKVPDRNDDELGLALCHLAIILTPNADGSVREWAQTFHDRAVEWFRQQYVPKTTDFNVCYSIPLATRINQ